MAHLFGVVLRLLSEVIIPLVPVFSRGLCKNEATLDFVNPTSLRN